MIAFSPQVVLTSKKEELIEDTHNAPNTCKWLREQNKKNPIYQKSLELKNFLPYKCEVEIHNSKRANRGADKKHALYVESDNKLINPTKFIKPILNLSERKLIEKNNNLYESMLDKTSESLEKIILNTESLSKIQ